jgi:hypothetical protein
MSGMPSSDHPLWPLIRIAIYMAALLGTLYFNASQFDATEIKSLVTMFLVAAGTEGIGQIWKSRGQ